MRTMNYKVSFCYEIDDGEKGEISETRMSREEVVRLLVMLSPLSLKDNLKNLLKLTRRNEHMVVSMNEGNGFRTACKFLRISR